MASPLRPAAALGLALVCGGLVSIGAQLPTRTHAQISSAMPIARRKGEPQARDYVLNPLGLILRGPITYVVGSIAKYDDVRTFALHRVERAAMLDDAVRRPKNFSLDAYLATGALHFGAGERIRLGAVFAASAAEHLYESPLAEDQTLTAVGEDRVRLQATVMDTPQLRWWLLAFGDNVEIKEPLALRRAFAKVATEMVKAYAATPDEIFSVR